MFQTMIRVEITRAHIHIQGASKHTHTGSKQARAHIHRGKRAHTHTGVKQAHTQGSSKHAHAYRGKQPSAHTYTQRQAHTQGQASTHIHRGKREHTQHTTYIRLLVIATSISASVLCTCFVDGLEHFQHARRIQGQASKRAHTYTQGQAHTHRGKREHTHTTYIRVAKGMSVCGRV